MLGYPIVYRRPEGDDAPPRYLAGQVVGGNSEEGWTLELRRPDLLPYSVEGKQQGGGRGEFHLAGALNINLREAEDEIAAAEAKAKADAEALAGQAATTKEQARAKAVAAADSAALARAAADEAEALAATAAKEAEQFSEEKPE